MTTDEKLFACCRILNPPEARHCCNLSTRSLADSAVDRLSRQCPCRKTAQCVFAEQMLRNMRCLWCLSLHICPNGPQQWLVLRGKPNLMEHGSDVSTDGDSMLAKTKEDPNERLSEG